MRTKLNKLVHCGTVGSEPTLLYTQDAVEFSNYNPVDLDCYSYNETTTAPLSQYSVYPTCSYDEELGFRIKTEQDLVFMEQPQMHNVKDETIDPWIQPTQFFKPQPEAPALHDIPEHFTDWSKFTPPISPSQSNEHELRIPFVPSKVRKRRSSSNSGRHRNSRSSMVPLSSPGPGAGSPGSQSSEGSNMDQLLVELRETRQLPWKDCAEVFKERGKEIKVPALQMRYKRLKDRAVIWEPEDVERLQEAKLNVEARMQENKMIWIAEEMSKLGGEDSRQYSPSSCEKKLKELGTLAAVAAAASPDS